VTDASQHTKAPFRKDQIDSINAYQESGVFHPFTCANDCQEILIAQESGMKCPSCGRVQTWVHDWMASNEWRRG